MKIKSVIKLCKRNRTAILYTQADKNGEVKQQYIGDGASIYPLDGMPMLEADNIPAMFGIPKKDISKWTISHRRLPDAFNMKDHDRNEIQMIPTGLSVCVGKVIVEGLNADGRAIWLDGAYMEPIENDEGMLALCLRENEAGTQYVAIKRGLVRAGIAMPYAGGWVSGKIREMAKLLGATDYDAVNGLHGQLGFEEEEEL